MVPSLPEGPLSQSINWTENRPAGQTDVLITHSHFDHVGGLWGADGKLAFPKAVIRMSTAEWAWMKSQPNTAALVKVIDGHVQTFTPGHVGYEITSGKQSLLAPIVYDSGLGSCGPIGAPSQVPVPTV
jgi:glyoxylase-like metal-dependent hydrolase (beta-lactamase superfamily II)